MFPSLAFSYLPRILFGNAVFEGDDVKKPCISSDCDNLLFCELAVLNSRAILSLGFTVTAFAHAVMDILHLRAQEQMVRRATRGSITTMARFKAVRDRSLVERPRHSWGTNCFWSESEGAVAPSRISSGPEPTSRSWFHADELFKTMKKFLAGFLLSRVYSNRHVSSPCRVDVFRLPESLPSLAAVLF